MPEMDLIKESDIKEETLEVVPAAEIKPEDIKEEDISDEMIEEFTKSKGKTLKMPKKAEKPVEKEQKEVTPKVEQKVEQKPEPDNEKKINYGAFHEQKQKYLEQKRINDELKAEMEKLKNPPAPIPTFEEDPLENTNLRLTQIEQQRQQDAEAWRLQQQKTEFTNAYAKVAQEYKQITPDFPDAYKFLISSRTKELSHFGYDSQQINQIIEAEEIGLVNNAFQTGLNPAAAVYEMAKLRGYSKPAPQQLTANSQKLDNIQRGQNLNKSFTGGKVAGQDLTEEVIDDIDNINPFENLRGKSTLDILFENMAKGR